jgi:hypothetical protein
MINLFKHFLMKALLTHILMFPLLGFNTYIYCWWYLFMLLLKIEGVKAHMVAIISFLFSFQKEPFDWQVTNIFGTWKLNHCLTIWDKKWGAIGNVFENVSETWWEQLGNLMRIHWEHWLYEISMSKTVCHHFQP